MFLIACSIVILIIIFIYTIHLIFIPVVVGKPPIQGLVLAYKYLYLGKFSRNVLSSLKRSFPNKNIVRLCYCGPKSPKLEFALGVNITDADWKKNEDFLETLITNELALFKTPAIGNALYSEYPIVPWLPPTKWIAIAIAYWKHFRFAQKYNLCAYPVLEIYSNYQVSVILPLLSQDEFVVIEAERIVFGRSYSAMLRPTTLTLNRQKEQAPALLNSLNSKKRKESKKSPRAIKG